jgi:hypothetical protein
MATRAEILGIVTSQEGYDTPPDGVISYALKMYSKYFPLYKEIVFTDLEGESEIKLPDEVYSGNIRCFVTINDYEYELTNFEFINSISTIRFFTPLVYNEVTVRYYTIHTFSTTTCTIPDKHAEAFAYLICHFMSLRQMTAYYDSKEVTEIDNGIIKVKYGNTTKPSGGIKTYFQRYQEIVSVIAPDIAYERDDIPEFSSTVDAINYPLGSEW